MATYVHNKSNAFQKLDDVQPPARKRSESRLKRYSSATDTRVWAHYSFDNKAYIVDLMGEEPRKKRKVMGQIIPIDVIWKIMLAGKNEYIFNLQARIDVFRNVLRSINLTACQISKIKDIINSSSNYFNFKDLLIDAKVTDHMNRDMNKSCQVKPKTLSTISETKISTNTVAVKTTPTEKHDKASITDMKTKSDQSNATIVRTVSHASIQVVLAPREMSDKCTTAKLHSASYLARKSKTEQTPELTMSKLKVCPFASVKVTSDRSIHRKSQSDLKSATSTNLLDLAASPFEPHPVKSKKSCVKFKESPIENQLHVVKSKPSKTCQVSAEELLESVGIVVIDDILIAIPKIPRTSSADDMIEVMSECEQTSLRSSKDSKDARGSVIQLYKSTKTSSIDSYIKQTSDVFEDEQKEIGITAENASNVEIATSISECKCYLEISAENNINVDQVDQNLEKTNEKVQSAKDTSDDEEQYVDCNCLLTAGSSASAESDEMMEVMDRGTHYKSCWFKDARTETKETKDKETHVISCIKSKKRKDTLEKPDDECWEKLKKKEEELQNTKQFAKRAMWQLELIRQTLLDNSTITLNLNVANISQNLQDSSKCNADILELERELHEICKNGENDACRILNAQLQVLKDYCNRLCIGEEENAKLKEENLRLKATKAEAKLESSHTSIVEIASNSEVSENKRQKQKIEYWKSKLVKYDQLNMERNMLRNSVLKLENELKLYDDIKSEFVPSQIDADADLQMVQIEDIQTQIIDLKSKASACEKLQKQLDEERNEANKLKESYTRLSTSKFNENEAQRYRAQEVEILRIEKDRLELKVSELQKFKSDNINLQSKCAELERLQVEKAEQPKANESVVEFKEDFEFANEQANEIKQLQKEKQALLRTVVVKECELADQEDQIERLVMHVDRLTTNNEVQQEKSQKLVAQMRSQLDAKENYIAKMDNELEWVEEKLKESISCISKDSNQWQKKMARLECCCKKYKAKMDAMQDDTNSLQKQLEMQEELNKNYSLELQKKNKILEEMLNEGGGQNLDQKMQNVNRMENILKKSHNAVRKVVEELAKQYRCDLKGFRDVVPEIINN